MTKTMLGCVRAEAGKLEVRQVSLPEIEEADDVILKVTLCTICGTDLHMADLPLPEVVMGHEGVGEIVEMGDAIKDFEIGDRVIASCLLACGRCANCQSGDQSACMHPEGGVQHGTAVDGYQAEYVRVPFASMNLCNVPDCLSDEQAILATDIFSTGLGVLERVPLKTGDTVAVFGQGPLGLCVTAAARALGAGRIIVVDPSAFRRETAKKMGANDAIDPTQCDINYKLLEMTDDFGVDIAVEAIGKQETLHNAFKAARFGGAVSSLGVYGIEFNDLQIPISHDSLTPNAFYHRRFITTFCPSGTNRLKRQIDLMQYSEIDLSALWTHTLPLEKILDGYEMARNPESRALKISVRPGL